MRDLKMLLEKNIDDIFSLRIVKADFYFTEPISGFDPIFSDFHGCEIKKIPVIRIFGPNKNGEKVCMHVHGVLPYFYIPYETNLGNSDQIIYQLAASIDKALNISLAQGNSKTKHVFKIVLVKGIPFYGYHRKEHQFLKIFLHNPHFVKRVTKLFENGAIFGKVFQPYEAHIPFVLQFLIDYNLYGMGNLNIEKEFVKYRQDPANDNDEINILLNKNEKSKKLCENITKKTSISKHEVDIAASHILNRFELTNKKAVNLNPGIELLWEDERRRRQKITKLFDNHKIPPLEISTSQDRVNVKPTESEEFYKKLLLEKIVVNEKKSEKIQKADVTVSKNYVYPEEFSQQIGNSLANASLIGDHLSSSSSSFKETSDISSTFSRSASTNKTFSQSQDNKDHDHTLTVDEKLILDLTQSNKQNETLISKDYEILKILMELEEDGNQNVVDLDSTLAPLSLKSPTKMNNLVKEKLENSILISQNENVENNNEEFKESNDEKTEFREIETDSDEEEEYKYSDCTLTPEQMNNILLQINANDVQEENTAQLNEQNILKNGAHRQSLPTSKLSTNHNATKKLNSPTHSFKTTRQNKKEMHNKEKPTCITDDIKIYKNCHIRVKRLKRSLMKQLLNNHKFKKNKIRSHSPSDVAREYDRKNNFFPEPGPSHINYYAFIDVPNPILVTKQTEKSEINDQDLNSVMNTQKSQILISTNSNDSNNLNNDDTRIHTFSEVSFLIDSPSILNDISLLDSTKTDLNLNNEQTVHDNDNKKIPSQKLPPKYHETLMNLSKYNISSVTHENPFYNFIRDTSVAKKSSILSGNTLNDLPTFHTMIPLLQGINKQRENLINKQKQLKTINTLEIQQINELKIREQLCSEKIVDISLKILPPKYIKQPDDSFSNKNLQSSDNRCCNNSFKNEQNFKNNKNTCNADLQDQKNSSLNYENLTQTPKIISLSDSFSQIRNSCRETRKSKILSNGQTNIKRKLNPIVRLERLENFNLKRIDKVPIDVVKEKNNSKVKTLSQLKISEKKPKKTTTKSSLSHSERSFDLSGPTLENTYGFKFNLDNLQSAKADVDSNFLTILSLEVFVLTRGDLKPNPEFDEIGSIFYSILENNSTEEFDKRVQTGYIIVKKSNKFNSRENENDTLKITYVEDEKKLIEEFIKLCHYWDPDILVGYEIEVNSWGYLIDRGKYLNINLLSLLSRVSYTKNNEKELRKPIKNKKTTLLEEIDDDRDELNDSNFEMKLIGRILLNLWRLMRSEITLTSYTFENVLYHVIHKRIPLYSFRNLTDWFQSTKTQWIVIEYYLERVKGNLELLNQLDLIDRTSEMAKLIGIQFYEVLSRGSQYRVESMMLRMAKPQNFVPLSPSVQQRAHMKAPEYLPLILEPESKMYVDPIIVLDFQSLYPSMIIAYNYCFSTCLGRIKNLGNSDDFEFGTSRLKIPQKYIKYLVKNDLINISPCGVGFVKQQVRKGILPKMLQEILDTRFMIKESAKLDYYKNSTLQKMLHSRQLALKLMANVTYGYTAANFSGRMPCVELGDSVVSKGRETLERAIKMVEKNFDKWGAKVIYGDTDSLFLILPGKTKEIAFKIGEEIAKTVTNDNPKPVKLKLEKIYQPCILQTKKRYVGYMYESTDQKNPIYEAKGIETVRRDGCPAVAKILEKSLRILFETKNVVEVKKYVCRQFSKILNGKINVRDLIFAKEFRGINGYSPMACVPALELTRKWLQKDPRNEPRRGERVPFVIVNGPPNVPLIQLVRGVQEFLSNDGYKINCLYYIQKALIPPLNRCLLLIGVDVNEWFAELPRKQVSQTLLSLDPEIMKNVNKDYKKSTISQYFSSKNCAVDCGRQTDFEICDLCKMNTQKCVVTLSNKKWKIDREYNLIKKICESCCGHYNNTCQSIDCPVLFVLNLKRKSNMQIEHYTKLLNTF